MSKKNTIFAPKFYFGSMKLSSIIKPKVWGSEKWFVFPSAYPLLFKVIDAHDNLSVQVHPSDSTAEDGHGKTEMWYVTSAQVGATILTGFNRDTDAREVTDALQQDNLLRLTNIVSVHAGDVAYLPAGTIHALCGGTQVIEIQQNCDVTYRLYDYNRPDTDGKPRPLHVREALKVLDYTRHLQPLTLYDRMAYGAQPLVRDPHFNTNMLFYDAPVVRDLTAHHNASVYLCAQGEGDINGEHIAPLEAIFIQDTHATITPQSPLRLLEVFVP